MTKPNRQRDCNITRRLVAWFDRAARPLPWRKGRKRSNSRAWASLVSEAMLQQTQASRVVECFQRFMRRFPTPADLAEADEQEVLAMWEGLGYYRRARYLLEAARMIVTNFRGRVPDNVNDLRTLPGVGRYTAGAVASIVFENPEPIVDCNVHRVLSRLDAKRMAADDLSWTWNRAGQLVCIAAEPGRFNEALMELGATVCTPRNPECKACPLARLCKAKRENIQHKIPPAKSSANRRSVHHHAVIIRRGRSILVEQRPAGGMWAAMWQVPTIESEYPLTLREVAERLPAKVHLLTNGGSFEHHTTHRRITFHILTAESRTRAGDWRAIDDLAGLPMSNAQRRILRECTNGVIAARSPGRGPARSP